MSAHTVITHAPNQGEESAHIQSLRAALVAATDALRVAEDSARDMGYTIPSLHDDVRAASRAEMDAYLALFDARHTPVGVSLAKVKITAEWERELLHVADAGLTFDGTLMPIGVAPGMRRNDLRALQTVFMVRTRLGGRWH